jgi:hypothetical protein
MKHKHAEVIKAFANGIECQGWDHAKKDWYDITNMSSFDFCDDARIKPEPKPKEYYDEDTFDVQYLHVYNHTIEGKTYMSPTFMQETYNNWKYMGKVRLEK